MYTIELQSKWNSYNIILCVQNPYLHLNGVYIWIVYWAGVLDVCLFVCLFKMSTSCLGNMILEQDYTGTSQFPTYFS